MTHLPTPRDHAGDRGARGVHLAVERATQLCFVSQA